MTANGVGEREGVGMAQHEAESESEHLTRELLWRQHVAAVRQLGEQQYGHRAGGIAQHEPYKGIERPRLELRRNPLQRSVARDERERHIQFREQSRWTHRWRRTVAGAAIGADADVQLTLHLSCRGGRRHVRNVRRPLQPAVERIGRMHHNVG